MLTTLLLISPWIGWLAIVRHHSQMGLFTTTDLMHLIARQGLFYLQRLPDQITGPFVEVSTVLHQRLPLTIAANIWATVVSGITAYGWLRAVNTSRRRLVGLVARQRSGYFLYGLSWRLAAF